MPGVRGPFVVDLDDFVVDGQRYGEDLPHGYRPLMKLTHDTSDAMVPGRTSFFVPDQDPSACNHVFRPYIMDPSLHGVAKWLDLWDAYVIVMTFGVSIATPYEVAFFSEVQKSPLLPFDILADASFVANMVLQFFLAFPDPKRPSRFVKEPTLIMKHYLLGWFVWDALSILPLDLFVKQLPRSFPSKVFGAEHLARGARILRLLRMARFSDAFRRFTHSSGLSFAKLTLLKFFISLILCCHWVACIWAGVAIHLKLSGENNWLLAVQAAKGGEDYTYEDSGAVYIIAVYWSIVTLTSIGYGDITPQCLVEYVISSFSMAIMAGMWAYVIASACSIASSMHPHELAFQRTMDDLNHLLSDRQMPMEMRRRFRRYFHESREMTKAQIEHGVVERMSPMLQGECAIFIHSSSIKKVRYLNRLSDDAVCFAARHVQHMVYAPNEEILSERIVNIVQRGVCAHAGKILCAGAVWGEDMLLSNDTLRDRSSARALSYVSLLRLSYDCISEVGKLFPDAQKLLRNALMKLAIVRGFGLISRTFRRWENGGNFVLSALPEYVREALYFDILNGFAPPDSSGTNAALLELYDQQPQLGYDSQASASEAIQPRTSGPVRTTSFAGEASPLGGASPRLMARRRSNNAGASAAMATALATVTDSLQDLSTRMAAMESKLDALNRVAQRRSTAPEAQAANTGTTGQPGRRPIRSILTGRVIGGE